MLFVLWFICMHIDIAIVLSANCRVREARLLPLHRDKSVIMQVQTIWCQLARGRSNITVQMRLLMVATHNSLLHPKLR